MPDGPVVTVGRPHPEVTVAFAPTKGDRPEWVTQKLTELGVDRIVPLRDLTLGGALGGRAGRQVDRAPPPGGP